MRRWPVIGYITSLLSPVVFQNVVSKVEVLIVHLLPARLAPPPLSLPSFLSRQRSPRALPPALWLCAGCIPPPGTLPLKSADARSLASPCFIFNFSSLIVLLIVTYWTTSCLLGVSSVAVQPAFVSTSDVSAFPTYQPEPFGQVFTIGTYTPEFAASHWSWYHDVPYFNDAIGGIGAIYLTACPSTQFGMTFSAGIEGAASISGHPTSVPPQGFVIFTVTARDASNTTAQFPAEIKLYIQPYAVTRIAKHRKKVPPFFDTDVFPGSAPSESMLPALNCIFNASQCVLLPAFAKDTLFPFSKPNPPPAAGYEAPLNFFIFAFGMFFVLCVRNVAERACRPLAGAGATTMRVICFAPRVLLELSHILGVLVVLMSSVVYLRLPKSLQRLLNLLLCVFHIVIQIAVSLPLALCLGGWRAALSTFANEATTRPPTSLDYLTELSLLVNSIYNASAPDHRTLRGSVKAQIFFAANVPPPIFSLTSESSAVEIACIRGLLFCAALVSKSVKISLAQGTTCSSFGLTCLDVQRFLPTPEQFDAAHQAMGERLARALQDTDVRLGNLVQRLLNEAAWFLFTACVMFHSLPFSGACPFIFTLFQGIVGLCVCVSASMLTGDMAGLRRIFSGVLGVSETRQTLACLVPRSLLPDSYGNGTFPLISKPPAAKNASIPAAEAHAAETCTPIATTFAAAPPHSANTSVFSYACTAYHLACRIWGTTWFTECFSFIFSTAPASVTHRNSARGVLSHLFFSLFSYTPLLVLCCTRGALASDSDTFSPTPIPNLLPISAVSTHVPTLWLKPATPQWVMLGFISLGLISITTACGSPLTSLFTAQEPCIYSASALEAHAMGLSEQIIFSNPEQPASWNSPSSWRWPTWFTRRHPVAVLTRLFAQGAHDYDGAPPLLSAAEHITRVLSRAGIAYAVTVHGKWCVPVAL